MTPTNGVALASPIALETGLDDDAVLTEPETRKRVRLSKATLIRMRQRPDCGGLPFVQLSPGRIGYLWRDVKAYILARRVGGEQPKAA
jgi:hypothetical protein